MQDPSQPSVNSWLEDELFLEYQYDRKVVDAAWTDVFESNGHTPKPQNGAPKVVEATVVEHRALPAPRHEEARPPIAVSPGDQLVPLRGPALRIAENMTASLSMPVATSQRAMPIKVLDENRRAINSHRSLTGQSKVSYTHLVAWAIVRSIIDAVPAVNQAYTESGPDSFRVTHDLT